jgi:hypothetical protein
MVEIRTLFFSQRATQFENYELLPEFYFGSTEKCQVIAESTRMV